jgi:phosphatidylcholine synthase
MKTKENFFKGFPVVWNMVVFTLFVLEPGERVSFAVVLISGILTFTPLHFLHPVRVVRLRPVNLTIFLLWCAFGIVALLQQMEASPPVKIGIAVTGVYLYFIGAVMQAFPWLGKRNDTK